MQRVLAGRVSTWEAARWGGKNAEPESQLEFWLCLSSCVTLASYPSLGLL